MLGPSPFVVPTPAFRFRSLAVAAGRAAIGGAREVALAVLVSARLAAGTLPPYALTAAQRRARADAVRSWIGTVALPGVPKVAIARLVEATAVGRREAIGDALAKVTEVTAPYLDRASRSELEALSLSLRT